MVLVNGRYLNLGNAYLPTVKTKVDKHDFIKFVWIRNPERNSESTCFTEGKYPKTQASMLPKTNIRDRKP